MPAVWFPGAVMYQIFPDRFRRSEDDTAQKGFEYHRSKGRTVYEQKNWDEMPLYKPLEGQKAYDPCDYFGGTLKGIEDSLDYIAGLGVDVIYLNPVFEAASNHRYNTADYMRIDPVLGSEESLKTLCEKAAERGIRIMLDGVFRTGQTASTSTKTALTTAWAQPTARNRRITGGTASSITLTNTVAGGGSSRCPR